MSSIEIFFINGKPGCGKDTQACEILKLFPQISERISTGEVYRGAKTQSGEYAKYHEQIKPYINSVDNGGLLPDSVIVPIVGEIIQEKTQNGISKFIFTGFPRTPNQLAQVDQITPKLESKNYYFHYQLSDEISQQRAQNRREKCLAKGEKVRVDDLPDIILRRLDIFHNKTEPMLQQLENEKRLITIDASGTIEEISEITKRKLSN